MKDADTDAPVIWPSWCYAVDFSSGSLKQTTTVLSPVSVLTSNHSGDVYCNSENRKRQSCADFVAADQLKPNTKCSGNGVSQTRKWPALRTARKMLSERSMLLNGFGAIESVKNLCDTTTTATSSSTAAAAAVAALPTGTATPTTKTAAAAAAAYLYLEKVKNEKLVTPQRVSAVRIDSLRDAAVIMESIATPVANPKSAPKTIVPPASGNSTNTNNNNDDLTITHVNSSGNGNHGGSNNNYVHQQQAQHLSTAGSSINASVKRERLSPSRGIGGSNGDLQASLSRSRSVTPSSSFHGTPPQQQLRSTTSPSTAAAVSASATNTSVTLVPMHNISSAANLLNSIQVVAAAAVANAGRYSATTMTSGSSATPLATATGSTSLPADFTARNYSDFMRSLAAKYNNNSNTSDSSSVRRSAFFNTPVSPTPGCTSALSAPPGSASSGKAPPSVPNMKPSGSAASSASSTSSSSSSASALSASLVTVAKEENCSGAHILPPPPPQDTLVKSQGAQNQMAAAAAAVSPFMTSLLSSLPFSQGVFPPLIDMSSTQALITLARAAKEAELQQILRSAQHVKRPATSAPASPRSSLTAALHQAAQYVSPVLLAAQLQSNVHPTPTSHTSPTRISHAAKRAGDKLPSTTPLDLSSQPPAPKRLKRTPSPHTSAPDASSHNHVACSNDALLRRRGSTSRSASSSSPAALADCVTAITTTVAACPSSGVTARQCSAQSEEVNAWAVNDVCAFVAAIDICAEYEQNFREQCIDGTGLPLLTEEHLVHSLGMKLGPALKLRSMLAKKLGGPCPCVACVAQAQQLLLAMQAAATAATSEGTALGGSSLTGDCGLTAATTANHTQASSSTAAKVSTEGGNNFAAALNASTVCKGNEYVANDGNNNNKSGAVRSPSSSNNNNNNITKKSNNDLDGRNTPRYDVKLERVERGS